MSRVKLKRWMSEIGKLRVRANGTPQSRNTVLRQEAEFFRIYDKISELHYQYDQMVRKASDAAELPTFEEKFKYPRKDSYLHALNASISGRRVRSDSNRIGTFGLCRVQSVSHGSNCSTGNIPEPTWGISE